HGIDHVVDQTLDLGRADGRNGYRPRLLTKYRMPEPRDLQDGHDAQNCSMGLSGRNVTLPSTGRADELQGGDDVPALRGSYAGFCCLSCPGRFSWCWPPPCWCWPPPCW